MIKAYNADGEFIESTTINTHNNRKKAYSFKNLCSSILGHSPVLFKETYREVTNEGIKDRVTFETWRNGEQVTL